MIRDRFIPTEGIHNLRDYGGWASRHGKQVRRGLLFRSGQHVQASDADLAAIDALKLQTVIDLRGESERTANPCRRSRQFDAQVLFFDGETASSPPHMDVAPDTTTAEFARARMIMVYTRMPRNEAMITMFGRYFAALDQRDGPSLVHCFAGKDRTGIAATLLLHVLGVSEEDQLAEFLLTNQAPSLEVLKAQSLPGIEARLGRKLDDQAVRNLLEVHEDYLATYVKVVEQDHGSLDAYLERALGVDDAMRSRLIARYVD